MRIAYVTHRFYPAIGGVEKQILALSTALTKKGHDVTVITSDLLRDRPEEHISSATTHLDQIEIRRHKAIKLLTVKHGIGAVAPGALRNLMDRFDIVHAHSLGFWPTYLGLMMRLLGRCRLVITPHCIPGSRNLGVIDIRLLPLRYSDAVVAQTELEREHLGSIGICGSKLVVIHPGLEARPTPKPSGNRTADRLVLFAGRLDFDQKGLDTLVRSIPIVLEVVRDVKFAFAGEDWGAIDKIESLAKELGVGRSVRFLGPYVEKNQPELFEPSDLVVLPSRGESFGMTLLEAMAAGKPIVATYAGAIPEVVRDRTDGLLVPPGDHKRLGEAIVRVLTSPSEAARMGNNGIERAAQFSLGRQVTALERLYSRLVN